MYSCELDKKWKFRYSSSLQFDCQIFWVKSNYPDDNDSSYEEYMVIRWWMATNPVIDNRFWEKYKDINLTTKLARKNMKICSSGNNWMGNAEAVHGQESFLRRSSAATMNMVELTKRKGRSYQLVFRNIDMTCHGTVTNVGILLWIKKIRCAKRGEFDLSRKA